jgi:putative YphP/YqiW family bacilliredoxin
MQSLYDLQAVKPYWEELKNIGVTPLTSVAEVENALANKSGTALLVVNSVCGCAAGHARPGVGLALQNSVIPDRLYTVFAGVDREATQRARDYIPGYASSSPSVALFKDGELAYMMERGQIERLDAVGVANLLVEVFGRYCSAEGPSVPRELFENNFAPPECSSKIPRLDRG